MSESTVGQRTYEVRVRKVVEYIVEVKPGIVRTSADAKAWAENKIAKAHKSSGEVISVTGYASWVDN